MLVQAGFDVQAVTDAPQMNEDIDNRLKKLDAVPGWILRLYEEIDSLKFGSGFDCFTSETEMVFGTAHVKGTEAIKEFFIKIDSPINSKHRVHEFWDTEAVKIVVGDAVISKKSTRETVMTPPLVNIFYMSDADPTKIRQLLIVAGPLDTDTLVH
jgi:hypothetical protein